jgi:hypothetical protein
MSGGTVDAYIEEKRNDNEQMEKGEDKVFIHFYSH